MSTGLPIIASRVGGADEVVKNNENGYLFEPKDVDHLAKILQKMINRIWRIYRTEAWRWIWSFQKEKTGISRWRLQNKGRRIQGKTENP